MTKNDITGDTLVSKASNINYLNNYDTIFRKLAKEISETTEALEAQGVGHSQISDEELFQTQSI